MTKFMALLAAVVLLLATASGAMAVIIAVGDPVEGGSWSQAFNESGVGPFDWMQVYMVPTDLWDKPAFSDFTHSSWLQVYNDKTYAAASGDLVTSLDFRLRFDGALAEPFEFYFQAYSGNILLETAKAKWSPGWIIEVVSGDSFPGGKISVPVPEPGTLLLLGSGLIGLVGGAKLKIGRKKE